MGSGAGGRVEHAKHVIYTLGLATLLLCACAAVGTPKQEDASNATQRVTSLKRADASIKVYGMNALSRCGPRRTASFSVPRA